MNDRAFIDTNIWIYAHLDAANRKCEQALRLLEKLPILVSSTQVLNEYYSVMLKKHIADPLIQDNIEVIISVTDIQVISLNTLREAHRIKLRYGFSYWDSLIMATALEAGCQFLYSEDMQHQQRIENQITVINPFMEKI